MPTSQGFRDLKVYRLAFRLAMEIFHESKHFPREEKFSLTDQIRRASRSVATNIGEGYRKKRYPKMFVAKMADADGEATETQVWLQFAECCGYLSTKRESERRMGYDKSALMGGMIVIRKILNRLTALLLPSAYCRRLLTPAARSCLLSTIFKGLLLIFTPGRDTPNI